MLHLKKLSVDQLALPFKPAMKAPASRGKKNDAGSAQNQNQPHQKEGTPSRSQSALSNNLQP